MSLSLTTLLIVCPLVFCGGFVDAIAGGGGLISISAYIFAGLPMHMVLGTNKLSSCIGLGTSTLRFALSGYAHLRASIVSAICAIIGSILGSNLALITPGKTFQVIMLILMPFIAFFIFRKNSPLQSKELQSKISTFSKRTISRIVITTFLIGIYDGFYGPATGTFLIVMLTSFGKLGLNDAIGLGKIANFSSALISFILFAISGNVWWQLGLICCVFSILGNFVGAEVVMKDGSKVVRPIIAIVLVLLFIKVISELLMQ